MSILKVARLCSESSKTGVGLLKSFDLDYHSKKELNHNSYLTSIYEQLYRLSIRCR
jgi:hypothetical protein